MAKINKNYLSIKEELAEKDKELYHSDDFLGISALTYPMLSSSQRSVMTWSHIKQHMVLKYPEPPRMYTNYEYIFGKISSGYKQSKYNYTVVSKIPRFSWLPNYLYTLILYNEDLDQYELLEKKDIENLTENFAYKYITDVIDSKEPGSEIKKDEILYRSTSYDEDMNYMFGRNVLVRYSSDPFTTEDALKMSESCAKRFASYEAETKMISINDNDTLGNFYGDNNNYKVFPDIGEEIKDDIITFVRRKFNNQVLYDYKDSNLKKINFMSDKPYYGRGIIQDIEIFCNKPLDEIDDNPFNHQLLKYLKEQERYWTELKEVTDRIISEGNKITDDIQYYNSRATKILDKEYKWRYEDQKFNNMMISITTMYINIPAEGSKFAGRCGNKGVISKIVPDEEMPYIILPDGTKRYCDVEANWLGVINRTNNEQLIEQNINYFADMIADKIHFELKTLKEKEAIFFKFFEIMNIDNYKKLKEYYDSFTSDERKELFFENVYKEGIYIHIPPFWQPNDESIFDRLCRLLKEMPWLDERPQMYIKKFGREIPLMGDSIMGEEYFMKLKQNSKKAFSACSLSSINEQNLPMKSKRAKDGLELYSKSSTRFGIQETTNFLIGLSPIALAIISRFYRSSPAGRRAMANALMSCKPLKDFPSDEEERYVNIIAEILEALLKAVGYGIKFGDEDKDLVYYLGDNTIREYIHENGTHIMCTELEWLWYCACQEADKDITENSHFIGDDDDLQEEINIIARQYMEELLGKTLFDEETYQELISNKY